jgi:L-malate glycosyltransferase
VGVQRAAFLESVFGTVPSEPVIATACFLEPRKRVEVLLRAAHILTTAGLRFRVLVCGEGSLRVGLEQLARELDLAGVVRFAGWVNDPVLIMDSADIFVLASVGEAFGNVLVEAMAASRPVVAARSGAMPEIVEHGVTGFLADADDPVDFARHLRVLIEDSTLREDMGHRGRTASQRFSLESFIEQTLAVYRGLLPAAGG